jgi:hypothetical protein
MPNTVNAAERTEMQLCPRCHRLRVSWLRSMARHSELDWFKCDGCDHIFTRPRAAGDEETPPRLDEGCGLT